MTNKHVARYIITSPRRWYAALKILTALSLRRKLVILPSDGIMLQCGLRGGTGLWCALTGLDYEPELGLFLDLLSPGDTFIDVGANIGTYAVRAGRKVGPQGLVVAIEPLAINFAKLEQAISINRLKNVKAINQAAGDRACSVTMRDGGRESSASINSTSGQVYHVSIDTLDNLVDLINLSRVDWIKMDIEGAEPLVIKGAVHVIEKFKPSILFENHEGGPETSQLLSRAGYKIGRISKAGRLEETTDGTNLFAVHPATILGKKSLQFS